MYVSTKVPEPDKFSGTLEWRKKCDELSNPVVAKSSGYIYAPTNADQGLRISV